MWLMQRQFCGTTLGSERCRSYPLGPAAPDDSSPRQTGNRSGGGDTAGNSSVGPRFIQKTSATESVLVWAALRSGANEGASIYDTRGRTTCDRGEPIFVFRATTGLNVEFCLNIYSYQHEIFRNYTYYTHSLVF